MTLKRRVAQSLFTLGIDYRRPLALVREAGLVRQERRTFELQRSASPFGGLFPQGRRFSCYGDRADSAGSASGHYFHQDLLVARAIFDRAPERHIDVGSRIDGFVAHVASFRQIDVIDIRPLEPVQGIRFIQADIMKPPEDLRGVADSVSCLHALEHFGLGRYGDPVEFDGWIAGFRGLTRLLREGGILYLSVPTSSHQRVEFNAHRIFSIPFIRDFVEPDFLVEDCAMVLDDGSLLTNVDPDSMEAQASFDANYGCSIWTLAKR